MTSLPARRRRSSCAPPSSSSSSASRASRSCGASSCRSSAASSATIATRSPPSRSVDLTAQAGGRGCIAREPVTRSRSNPDGKTTRFHAPALRGGRHDQAVRAELARPCRQAVRPRPRTGQLTRLTPSSSTSPGRRRSTTGKPIAPRSATAVAARRPGSIAPRVAACHSAQAVAGSSDAYSGHGSPGAVVSAPGRRRAGPAGGPACRGRSGDAPAR